MVIVHGAGARTLELYARDGDLGRAPLDGIEEGQNLGPTLEDYEVRHDPSGKLCDGVVPHRPRPLKSAHLSVNVAHSGPDHRQFLF